MSRCFSALKSGGIIAWYIGNGSTTRHAHTVHQAGLLESNGFIFTDMIAWVKPGPNFSVPRHMHIKGSGYYYPAHQWETIHVYQKPGPMPKMTLEARNYMWEHASDVWQIRQVAQQQRQYGHPAVCPVEIPFRTMQAYTQPGESVFDPCAGSGTTLMAAEQTGRTAFLIEKDPGYCDQILKRWETFTGKKARKITSRA